MNAKPRCTCRENGCDLPHDECSCGCKVAEYFEQDAAWAAAWDAGDAAWDARAAARVATGAAGDAALACMTERLFQYLRGEA